MLQTTEFNNFDTIFPKYVYTNHIDTTTNIRVTVQWSIRVLQKRSKAWENKICTYM